MDIKERVARKLFIIDTNYFRPSDLWEDSKHQDKYLKRADQIIPIIRADMHDKINKALEPAGLHLCWITEGDSPDPISYGLADDNGDEIDIAVLGEKENEQEITM